MRLIDADVLMDLLEKGWKTTSRDAFTHHTIDRTDVEGTPTIEAIPIEWIEKWNEEKCIKAINWLIEDWRKENETD